MPAFKNCEPTNLGMIYSHGKHIQACVDASSQNKPWVAMEVVSEYQILFLGSTIFWRDPRNERVGISVQAEPVPKPTIFGLANGLPYCPKRLLWQSALLLQSAPLLSSIEIWPKSTAWPGIDAIQTATGVGHTPWGLSWCHGWPWEMAKKWKEGWIEQPEKKPEKACHRRHTGSRIIYQTV